MSACLQHGGAGTRKAGRRDWTGPVVSCRLCQLWGVQGSYISIARSGDQTRNYVRASCPCCSLLAGLLLFPGSQAEATDVPGWLPGPGPAAAAASLPKQQVVLRSVLPTVGTARMKGGQRDSCFWAVLWQGSELAKQPCQLAWEMLEQTSRSRRPHASLGESFLAVSVLPPAVFVA